MKEIQKTRRKTIVAPTHLNVTIGNQNASYATINYSGYHKIVPGYNPNSRRTNKSGKTNSKRFNSGRN